MPPRNNRLRAFLFDLDGVLWSSTNAHRLAFQQALHDEDYPWTLSKKAFTPLAGMTTERAFQKLMANKKRRCTADQLERFSHRKRILALQYLRRQAALEPGLVPLLKKLHRTYRLALVSSSHPQTVKLFLKRSRARRYFEVILSNGDVPASKPSPRIYKTALRRLHVKPREARAIEDTVSGVQAATGAGIAAIGMRGTCAPDLLRRAGAFKIITRLSELVSYAADLRH